MKRGLFYKFAVENGRDYFKLLWGFQTREQWQSHQPFAYIFGDRAITLGKSESSAHRRQVQRQVVKYREDVPLPELLYQRGASFGISA